MIHKTELELIRESKKCQLLARETDKMPMFSLEQKATILEHNWLIEARSRFFSHKNVYLWVSTEADARKIADEQCCPALFREEGIVKVIQPGASASIYLDEILLGQDIDAFTTGSANKTVETLFPRGFANKAFYYVSSCAQSVTKMSVFEQPPSRVSPLAAVKDLLQKARYIHPKSLTREDAEALVGQQSKFVLRESTSRPGAIAITFYDTEQCQHRHCLLDTEFRNIFPQGIEGLATAEDILREIQACCFVSKSKVSPGV